ncbi:MAG: hypothetical protein ACFFF4_09165 [Candidatus Thorarchaeota archaeon]
MADTIALLRDGVFGSLNIHSLSLALDIPTSEILDILMKGKSWKEGLRDARAFCSVQVSDLISNHKVDYIDQISLKRDGFGYLIPQLDEALLEQYRKAKPQKEAGNLILKPLARTVHGRKVLRTLGITTPTIKASSEHGKQLLREYENYLIEIETDTSKTPVSDVPTEQLTLEGEPVSLEEEEKEISVETEATDDGVQAPLSEYIPTSKKKKSAKEASRQRRKGRREKKAKSRKEGKK